MNKYWDNGPLKVMENGRYFANGESPYFMLGDTAWTLFQRLDLNNSYRYLKNRKEKGYNTILATLINFQSKGDQLTFSEIKEADVSELITPTYDSYWMHVQSIVKTAEQLGLYVGLLPVWGSVYQTGYLNCENVEGYTRFLVDLFKPYPNIFWVLGGDHRGDDGFEVWDKMGTLFKEEDPNRLVSYHPFGRTSSSYWFHVKEWLDFNMFQSGHRRSDQRALKSWDDAAASEPWFGEENWRYVQQDLRKLPNKPVLDGEPSYEQIPQGLHDATQPYWQAHHARRYAYWSVFSGAAGHIYGHNAIMQFYGTGGKQAFGALEPWDISLHDVGSSHMKVLKDLLEEINFSSCSDCTELLFDARPLQQEDFKIAFGSPTDILIYSYNDSHFTVNAMGGSYEAYWIDPQSGIKSYIDTLEFDQKMTFIPPQKKTSWSDWVLYLKTSIIQ